VSDKKIDEQLSPPRRFLTHRYACRRRP